MRQNSRLDDDEMSFTNFLDDIVIYARASPLLRVNRPHRSQPSPGALHASTPDTISPLGLAGTDWTSPQLQRTCDSSAGEIKRNK